MQPKNISLGMGTLTMTDENGKSFEIGEVSEMECSCDTSFSNVKYINGAKTNSLEFTIKLPWRTRMRFKWEVWKAKRRARKVVKAFYDDNQPHEFTLTITSKKEQK